MSSCDSLSQRVQNSLEGSSLYAQMDRKMKLIPISETMFIAQGAGLQVEFIRSGRGEVAEAVAHFRNGRQERHKKAKEPGAARP